MWGAKNELDRKMFYFTPEMKRPITSQLTEEPPQTKRTPSLQRKLNLDSVDLFILIEPHREQQKQHVLLLCLHYSDQMS